ncbi:MAG: lipocalin family protein [Bacteroidales bacterium]
MKRINYLIALAVIVFAFTSCEDEESFDMTGTWTQEKSEITISSGIPGVEDFSFSDDEPVTVTFNEDGTGEAVSEEGTDSFNWSLADDKLTISDDEMPLTLTLTTMTDSKVVGEQTLTSELILAAGFLDPEEEEMLDQFGDFSGKITLTLVR